MDPQPWEPLPGWFRQSTGADDWRGHLADLSDEEAGSLNGTRHLSNKGSASRMQQRYQAVKHGEGNDATPRPRGGG